MGGDNDEIKGRSRGDLGEIWEIWPQLLHILANEPRVRDGLARVRARARARARVGARVRAMIRVRARVRDGLARARARVRVRVRATPWAVSGSSCSSSRLCHGASGVTIVGRLGPHTSRSTRPTWLGLGVGLGSRSGSGLGSG